MAEAQSSGGTSAAIVAIVAIVLLVLIGFFVLRGFGHRGGAGSGGGLKGNVEIAVPRPGSGPGK